MTKRYSIKQDDHTVSIETTGEHGTVQANLVSEMLPARAVEHEDGSMGYAFTAWPSVDDAKPYGNILTAPVPYEMAHLVGRIIVQSALVEGRVKSLLKHLASFNQTTLDWQKISKYRKIVSRLQEETALIASRAPVGAKLLHDAAEGTRDLQRSRGNLAHGEIRLAMGEGTFRLIATGKHEEDWFSEDELRDLALRFCRASYELKAALDPDYHTALRAPPEAQFLRGFQASSPLIPPSPPTPPRPPRSSKQSTRP